MLSNNYSPLNNNPNTSAAPQPRGLVLINGINVLWVSIEVTTTTYFMADTWHIVLPMSNQPAEFDMNFFASAYPVNVEIYMGFPNNPNQYNVAELAQMISGVADKIEIDPLSRTVTMSGRDLTAKLIDTKIYNNYTNQSSSEIATALATSQGLGTSQITQTSEKAGTFVTYNNTLMSRETTQWDLLSYIAQQQDFVTYVQGNDLVFKPRPTMQSSKPFVLNFQPQTLTNGSVVFPGMQLNISRSLTLASDVTVKVRVPVNPQTGVAFTKTITSSKKNSKSKTTGNQVYSYTFPGLSPAQAVAKGQQILRDISIHELKLNIMIPGEIVLQKDSLIQLSGTNSPFDQIYFTDMITRTMSVEDGFQETISCKNTSANTATTL